MTTEQPPSAPPGKTAYAMALEELHSTKPWPITNESAVWERIARRHGLSREQVQFLFDVRSDTTFDPGPF